MILRIRCVPVRNSGIGTRTAASASKIIRVGTRTAALRRWDHADVATNTPQTIAYPAPGSRPYRRDSETLAPHVIVLFGATGDLAKRKLIPGLAYLEQSSLLSFAVMRRLRRRPVRSRGICRGRVELRQRL